MIFFKAFFIKKYTSNFAFNAILLKMKVDDKFYSITFYSRKFSAIKINYKIHNKKLLAIQEW